MDYMKDLSPELQKIAREKLNEDPATTKHHIEHIKEWLKKQPHINARTDDRIILRFLRGCKFSLQKTKDKLEMYYTCRGLIPEWFSNRDPLDSKIRRIHEMGEFLPLNDYDSQGRKIVLIRSGIHDPSSTSMDEVLKAYHIIYDLMIEEDVSLSVAGLVYICDVKAITPSNVFQMTPGMMKKMMTVSQEGYPERPKSMHYVNISPTFEKIFHLAKTFMKEKIRKRIHFHGNDVESLQEYFSKDILPIEYGGTRYSLQDLINEWVNKVIQKREWLLNDEQYKADESKRLGKIKTTLDLFGVDGSFKKLNND